MKKILLLVVLELFIFDVSGQDYHKLIEEGNHTVQYISEVAEQHFDSVGRGRGTGFKIFKRWQYFAERAIDETGKLKSPEFYYQELENYNAIVNSESVAARTTVGTWEEMGPTYWDATSGWNPGVGRITSLAVDESNLNHIITGSETGGVWKSTDGGSTWAVLSDNLSNIDVYALAIDPTDSDTYYWGSTSGTIFKSSDGGATWLMHGSLPGGAVNRILIDPNNTLKMYASAQGGGLYKSTDGGNSWAIIASGATTGYDFEFRPGDSNTIYASGNNFYVSTDGGITFTTDTGLNNWSQEFVSGSTLWTTAGSNQNGTITPRTGSRLGLFYIGNFSTPVTRLVTPPLNLNGAVNPRINFSYSNVQWAGDIDELRVLYKTSSGGSWIELAQYTAESTSWSDITINLPNVSSEYYIAFEGTSNYGRGLTLDDISVEANNLGTVFSDGFESSSNAFASGPKMIGVSANNPDIVYVLEANSGLFGALYTSNNSGSSFTKLTHTQNFFGYDSNGNDALGQAPRDMDITVNPNNVNDVHIAGINTWRSTDGGVSFNITSQWVPSVANGSGIGYCHADVDIMHFAGTGTNAKLYVGTDGGIFRADNPTNVSASYYTDLTPGLGIRQFYKIGVSQTDPVVVTGGSQDNGTSTLREDGLWTDWLGADGMEGFVDKNDTSIMYGTTQFGLLYRTQYDFFGSNVSGLAQPDGKGGQSTWNWVVPFEQDPIVQNTIYVAFDEIYKSDDSGANWVSISPNFAADIDHFKIAPSNNQVMYCAINGVLRYTTNGGINWTVSPLSLGGSAIINEIAVHPSDPNKVAIATTDNQKVYVSSNGGLTWTSKLMNLPGFVAQALAWQDNGDDGLYVGMNYGVFYTDNTLTEWVAFNNGLPNVRVNELEINTVDNKIYAATYGRGLWRSNVYDSSLSVNDFDFSDLVLYPNPAVNEVNLKWNKPEDVSIRIFDTQGKIMFYGKKVNLFNGFKVNVSSFNSGIYFVKLNSSKGEITKKLILK